MEVFKKRMMFPELQQLRPQTCIAVKLFDKNNSFLI